MSRQFRVALVSMPFGPVDGPSIQLGLLKSVAQAAGFQTDTFHFNLELSGRLGASLYSGLSKHRGRMTGEWLFGAAAFGDEHPASDAAEDYLLAFPDVREWAAKGGRTEQDLLELRAHTLPAFIRWCAEEGADWAGYDVVGFTSSFQQNVASLALARRIKERSPDTKIIFGGANMEGEMGLEYVRAFPCIDAVVVGEGDNVLPELLDALSKNKIPLGIRGVALRDGGRISFPGQADPVRDMNALPVPDYQEYFDRARRIGIADRALSEAGIPFESSRGCWWGQKHHCTFCGLNGLGMTYRSKTPDRLLAELEHLANLYGVLNFRGTDNILDNGYPRRVFEALAEQRLDYRMFFEVKANLTQEQLRLLAFGGVHSIQPGIESLSTRVLALMCKGTTALQNVRLLKWSAYFGIQVAWNTLWGFPGERAEDYAAELTVMKHITYLEPPLGGGRIWMERFSPYFTEPERWGVRWVRPERSYAYAYPKQSVDLTKVAYFFDYEFEDTLPDEAHHATSELIAQWQQSWQEDRDVLRYRRTRNELIVEDGRRHFPNGTHTFAGEAADIYESCVPTYRSVRGVQDELRKRGRDSDGDAVRATLDALCERGLMLHEDGKYLSLANPVNPNW